jgi:Zn-finger nucleic acid-binding protein
MAKWINCAAPLPPNSLRCEYCGTINDIDLSEIAYHTTHETSKERICPRCGTGLQSINLEVAEKFLVEKCQKCRGLFLTRVNLKRCLRQSFSMSINYSLPDNINNVMGETDFQVTDLHCPLYSQLMKRVNFGVKSGVVVDQCKEHSTWLDAGKLRHLMAWVKAGGEILDQVWRERKRNLTE